MRGIIFINFTELYASHPCRNPQIYPQFKSDSSKKYVPGKHNVEPK